MQLSEKLGNYYFLEIFEDFRFILLVFFGI